MNTTITIGNRRIGPGEPAYIIAELSGNHHSDKDIALQMVEAAAAAGVDAVKLQTFTADGITVESDKEYFDLGGITMYEAYKNFETPREWTADLKARANGLGLTLFSSPFDVSAVDFLQKLNMPAYKIASFELVDMTLLKAVAKTGKPVIMSTGMATQAEIEEAVQMMRSNGCDQIALLKCTSSYPAPPEEMNLNTIPRLAELYGCPSGLSDHTLGITLPIAAAALGANVIEKHFILDRSAGGPESSFALEPDELKQLVESVRMVEKSLGKVHFGPEEREAENLKFRRSLFVVEDIKAGEAFTEQNVRSVRPSNGLHTRHYDEILGKTAAVDIEKGTPMAWDLIKR
ncbi:pseudaminic acid synthase [bacterium BMS3Bbin04]|nr:pseudaminic acid synthase [bacterium BMS3Bbin04]